MNENYLDLLNAIRDTLEDIKGLREDLHDLLANPGITLENLGEIRDTLAEIKGLQEDVE